MEDESTLIKQTTETGWPSGASLCPRCYGLFSTTSSLKALLSDEGISIRSWDLNSNICVLCNFLSSPGLWFKPFIRRLKAVLGAASQTIESFRNLDAEFSLVPDPEYPVNALRIRDLMLFDPMGRRRGYQPHLLAVPDYQSRLLSIPPLQTQMDSPWIMQETKLRIKTCQEEHPLCPGSKMPLVPRRVIDVGGKDGATLKLYEPKQNERANYATLSYCWGTKPQFTTTLDLMADLLDDMSKRNLSQTHLDAIRVTRGLGIRYLWIDALCIIQDSPADMMLDMPNMGNIYKNSTITIAASEAQSAHSGFLGTPKYPPTVPLPFLLPDGSKETVWLSCHKAKLPTKSHLNTRGWTLQESLLSPRQITFGYSEVLWQCQTKCMQPVCQGAQDYAKTFENMSRLPGTIYGIPTPLDKKTRPPRDIWEAFVNDYSARKFTVVEDRWSGMAGIIGELSKLWTDDECVAGFWKSSMLESLAWNMDENREPTWMPPRQKLMNAPSWSWLSLPSKVFIQHFSPEDLEIVDCAVTPLVETAPHGALKEAVLILRGKAITLTELKRLPAGALNYFQPNFDSQVPEHKTWDSLPSKAWIQGEWPDGTVFLRAGRAEAIHAHSIGIILEQLEGDIGRFRRIGVWIFRNTQNFRLKYSVEQEFPEVRSAWQDAITREWKII